MGVENAVCPYCGKEIIVTVPAGHRLRNIVQNPKYNPASHEGDKKLTTQWSKCSHCNHEFGAVTRDET